MRCWPWRRWRSRRRRRRGRSHTSTTWGVSQNAKPKHKCPKKSKKGAFFKSLQGDVNYSICVKFPTGKNICAKAQPAKQGTLYVNKITSNIPGKHRVTWFVEGKRVGVFLFQITG